MPRIRYDTGLFNIYRGFRRWRKGIARSTSQWGGLAARGEGGLRAVLSRGAYAMQEGLDLGLGQGSGVGVLPGARLGLRLGVGLAASFDDRLMEFHRGAGPLPYR